LAYLLGLGLDDVAGSFTIQVLSQNAVEGLQITFSIAHGVIVANGEITRADI
jgi:hypothetical protein